VLALFFFFSPLFLAWAGVTRVGELASHRWFRLAGGAGERQEIGAQDDLHVLARVRHVPQAQERRGVGDQGQPAEQRRGGWLGRPRAERDARETLSFPLFRHAKKKAQRSKLINMTRAKPEVPPPQWFRLTEEELYPNGAKLPDHDLLKKHLREEGRLTLNCAAKLLGQASELLRQEPNMLNLTNHIPLRICGDIHGQFYDLLNLVEMAGDPKRDSFLFLGDYVDRGMFSTEVVLYLAALKINFPNKVFMLRGNHECRLLTSHFNFMDEVVHKYDSEVYYMFMELFDVLPIAAFLENDIGRFLLVHGGISPELLDLSQINEIDRFVEPPGEGLLCDLLWSDPIDEATGDGLDAQERLEWDSVDYVPNPDRGCSWVFGYSAITEFLEQLNLVSVVRAHEVQKAGFKEHRFLKQREHPHLITVFSAPNYWYEFFCFFFFVLILFALATCTTTRRRL
jgi:diadenosine tetraphosphatase ApaH/serine/threonine PP2A family protein phosphatase